MLLTQATGKMLLMLIFTLVLLIAKQEVHAQKLNSNKDKADRALQYVEYVRNKPCSGGGTSQILQVRFNYSIWNELAGIAVRSANFFTKLWLHYNGTPPYLDDTALFSMSRANIESNERAFGCMVAFGEYQYKDYRQFCSYAYKKYNRINVHDISVNYKFLESKSTEWWNVPNSRKYVLREWDVYLRPRYNSSGNMHGKPQVFKEPYATIDDGHWTNPYFDCGGGDIWMVTYSAPIFSYDYENNETLFSGIVGMDIDLSHIDIDQCDHEDDEPESTLNIFYGTHKCRPTTECKKVHGLGFVRGAYVCACRDGYHFPDIHTDQKTFPGKDVELAYYARLNRRSGRYMHEFDCVPCQEGCATCFDDSPCLAYRSPAVHMFVLVVCILTVAMILVFAALTAYHKDVKVIKGSSPWFLYVMCFGAFLQSSQVIVNYMKPDYYVCTIMPVLKYTGFALLYGALLLKTWRIAKVFRIKSAKRLKITDKDLAKRFIPILLPTFCYLGVWVAAIQGDRVVEVTNKHGLRYKSCLVNWWDHGALIARSLFLMWGVYLCYVIRRAPSSFNESRYISIAIYNCISTGTFVVIIRLFIATQTGPSMIYVMSMLELQIKVTVTMCVIFFPKFYLTYTGRGNEVSRMAGDQSATTSTRSSDPSIQTTPSQAAHSSSYSGKRGQPVQSTWEQSLVATETFESQVKALTQQLKNMGVCGDCIESISRYLENINSEENATKTAKPVFY